MHEYEYVARAEYQPVRERLEQIIHKVQMVMREKYDTTFQYRLIGSGKKHLITRIKGGNAGFDFDYNLVLQAPESGYVYRADVVKQQFMTAFREALKGTEYRDPQDSTSAITIKVVDKKNSRIVHSCDFAIIYYDEDLIENGYFYLKCQKSRNNNHHSGQICKTDSKPFYSEAAYKRRGCEPHNKTFSQYTRCGNNKAYSEEACRKYHAEHYQI